ncbi:Cytochrome P450 [Jatrophihabitans endophyticus]|uniref:Cytochrome P450 n=1 Tax=Jatrophihabitans endophyticus TaxID=1206085 RepID=A0A1M5PTM9_9ACTN|nr:cytochrome P450 [Jatrophihabitans endophyticus]SHH05244.1 Cytochrome P450 [Jatrophihabitans endophyticus]
MADTHEPTVDFDHHTPEFGQDAARKFAELRERCPVAHSAHYEGFWVASTYDTARQVISDDVNFTVERSADGTQGGKLIPTAAHAPSVIPGVLDGEAHDRLRRPLRTLFAKGSIEKRVAPVARRVADELAAELAGRDEFDFAHEFSFRLTVATIFDFVGLDEIEDKGTFILMLEDAFAIDPEAGGERDALATSVSGQYQEAAAYVLDVVRARTAEPRDDLISHLVDPATGFTEDECVSLALSMVLGGVRTTASSMDHIVLHLDGDRELRARLRDDRSLIPGAVDELTRLSAVTPLVARTARHDVRLGAVQVRAGDRVAALIASANLDEDRFGDAAAVQLGRRDGLHLSFGAGLHYCLGIWLAKMELRTAIETLLDHMPDYAVVTEGIRRYELVGVNNGFHRLPVRPRP